MKKLDVHYTTGPDESRLVGTLAEDRGRVYFEYAADFLAGGVNLSPFRLPFEAGLFEHRDREFGSLPGLFDDSLPDGWGLLLMDRHFRSVGRALAEVSPLDRLAWLGTRTMGALTYHPPVQREGVEDSVFDLHELSRQAREIYAGTAAEVLPQLLQAGGSPGGARPKVLVGLKVGGDEVCSGADDLPEGFEHWIVKFFAKMDGDDAGAAEYAYSLMARDAGVDMPPTRLFTTSEGDRFFGVKRFDRRGNRRCHVHTFGNLIQANFRIPSADYADLLKATSLLTRNHQDVLQAYRRMVFNVLGHNRDDHVKNFAFVMDGATGEWKLSPAYDVLYTPGPGGEHTMTVAGEGRNPGRRQMLRLAEMAGVSTGVAEGIMREVQAAIGRWPDYSERAGVGGATARRIARSLRDLGG